MRTVRTKIYKFSELSAEAQEKALEYCRTWNVDYDWYDGVFENFKISTAPSAGFEVDNIYFDLSYSQGDGAMFEGQVKYFHNFLEGVHPLVAKLVKLNKIELSCKIKHYGHYHHENSKRFDFNFEADKFYPNIEKELEKVENNINTAYVIICRELYNTLQQDYEYLTSNEAVKETIEANNYEFYANGEFYSGK